VETKVNLHVGRQRKRCCDAVLMTNRPPISRVVALQEPQRQKTVLSKMILSARNNKNSLHIFFKKKRFEEES